MNQPLTILESIGTIVLGLLALVTVNFSHDYVINSLAAGSATDHIPLTTQAEIVSVAIVFWSGVAASFLVSLLAGAQQTRLVLILAAVLVLANLAAVGSALAGTSLLYRLALVALVPLQVWVGHLLGKKALYLPPISATRPRARVYPLSQY